jgi:hypothetical protein
MRGVYEFEWWFAGQLTLGVMTMRLRVPRIPVPRRSSAEQSSHLVLCRAHGATEAAVTSGEPGDIMTAQTQGTVGATRPVRAAAGEQPRVVVRGLPAAAFGPGPAS